MLLKFIRGYKHWIIGALIIIIAGSVYLVRRYNAPGAYGGGVVISSSAVVPDNSITDENAANNVIKVYITGEVANPGVYEIQPGARVDDLLALAGGATAEADLLNVNLAAYVKDAERVIIPSVNAAPGGLTETDGLIDINTADKAALMTLPGIGDVLAESIIEYREANGGFNAVEDIKNVGGIGDGKFSSIKDKIKV